MASIPASADAPLPGTGPGNAARAARGARADLRLVHLGTPTRRPADAVWLGWSDRPVADRTLAKMQRTLDALSPEERSILQVLAVFAREIRVEWVTHALGLPPGQSPSPAVARLRAEGLIAPALGQGSPLVSLPSPVHATACYFLTPENERRRLHAAAIRLISTGRGKHSAPDYAEIAWHGRFASPLDEAIKINLKAAQACFSANRLVLADECFAWLQIQRAHLTEQQAFDVGQSRAQILRDLGRPNEAFKLLEDALKERTVSGNPARFATAVNALAALHNELGHHSEALDALERADRVILPSREKALAARLVVTRSFALWGLGKIDEADQEVRRVLKSAPEDAVEVRRDLWSMAGTIAFTRRDLDSAASYYREALRLAERHRHHRHVAELSANLGMVEGRRGRLTLAQRLLYRMLKYKRRNEDLLGVANTLNELGRLALHVGDIAVARHRLEEANEVARTLGDDGILGNVLHNLAGVARTTGNLVEAQRLLREMRERAIKGQRAEEVAFADSNLAWVAVERASFKDAACLLASAQSAFAKMKHAGGLAFCVRVACQLAEETGNIKDLDRLLQAGRTTASEARQELFEHHFSMVGAWARRAEMGHDTALAAVRAAREFFVNRSYLSGVLEADRREAGLFLDREAFSHARMRFHDIQRRAHRAGFELECLKARIGEALSLRTPEARRSLLDQAEGEARRLRGVEGILKRIRAVRRIGLGEPFEVSSPSAEPIEIVPLPASPSPALPPTAREKGRVAIRWTPGRFKAPDLAPGYDDVEQFEGMVGQSPAMKAVFREVERLRAYDRPILIEGETGTGKELLAAAIHKRGPRMLGPYVKISCTSIPGELLESELFGSVAGAYTGAVERRRGLWLEAHQGDLLLDDLQDLPSGQQVKLLRVIEDGEVRPVGGTETQRADVRVIATINRPIDLLVEGGMLRRELLFRIGAVVLRLPPLRERIADLPPLAMHFIRDLASRMRSPVPHVEPGALDGLSVHAWPGNVRELSGFVETLLLGQRKGEITAALVAERLAERRLAPAVSSTAAPSFRLRDCVEAVRYWCVRRALRATGGALGKASELLGITRQQLHKYLSEWKRRPPAVPNWPTDVASS